MRISDWSSDVCSSDLPAPITAKARHRGRGRSQVRAGPLGGAHRWSGVGRSCHARSAGDRNGQRRADPQHPLAAQRAGDAVQKELREVEGVRSEEHTSELQSLMRISYAVFCLKKKTETTKANDPIHS